MTNETRESAPTIREKFCSPFALCINDTPVMRVSAESALECAGAAYHALMYGRSSPPAEFSIGLRRLNPADMARLPAMAGPAIESVIFDLFDQIVNAVGVKR